MLAETIGIDNWLKLILPTQNNSSLSFELDLLSHRIPISELSYFRRCSSEVRFSHTPSSRHDCMYNTYISKTPPTLPLLSLPISSYPNLLAARNSIMHLHHDASLTTPPHTIPLPRRSHPRPGNQWLGSTQVIDGKQVSIVHAHR